MTKLLTKITNVSNNFKTHTLSKPLTKELRYMMYKSTIIEMYSSICRIKLTWNFNLDSFMLLVYFKVFTVLDKDCRLHLILLRRVVRLQNVQHP